MKQHKCIEKDCPFFERFNRYPYWKSYYSRVIKETNKKEAIKHDKLIKREINKQVNNTLQYYKVTAEKYANLLEFDMCITNVVNDTAKPGGFVINYVSNNDHNDYYLFIDLCKMMSIIYSASFVLKHIKTPDGYYAVKSDITKYKKRLISMCY
jgi:hypothetical protein